MVHGEQKLKTVERYLFCGSFISPLVCLPHLTLQANVLYKPPLPSLFFFLTALLTSEIHLHKTLHANTHTNTHKHNYELQTFHTKQTIAFITMGYTPRGSCTVQRGYTPRGSCSVQRGYTPRGSCSVQRGYTPRGSCVIQKGE